MPQPNPRSEHIRSAGGAIPSAAASGAAVSGAAVSTAPSPVSPLASANLSPPSAMPPRKRAIDILRRLQTTSDPPTNSIASSSTLPPPLNVGSSAESSSSVNRPLRSTAHAGIRARDVLHRIASRHPPAQPLTTQFTSEPRQPDRPQKRRRSRSPEVDIDLTMDSSSDEEDRPPRPTFPEPEFVYNTNDLLATRQTVRGWRNSSDPSSWILSREELHSDQVDLDRLLPEAMDDYPSFVRCSLIQILLFLIIIFPIVIGHLRR
jgi:hypothetical protein